MSFFTTLTIGSLMALAATFQAGGMTPPKRAALLPLEGNSLSQAAQTAPTSGLSRAESEWKSLGMGRFTDGLAGALYFSSMTWDVEVEQNADEPAIYRMVNPYTNGHCPWNADGRYTTDATVMHYITFDTSDPDAVTIVFEGSESIRLNLGVTMSDGDGECQLYNNRATGTFANSIIHFDPKALAVTTLRDQGAYYAEMTKLTLPGAPDYDVTLTTDSYCFAGNKALYTLSGARDAAEIRCVTVLDFYSSPGECEYFDNIMDSAEPAVAGNYQLKLPDQGWYTIFAGAFDSEGALMSTATANVYAFVHNDSEWEELGTGQFTDDSFAPIYNIEEMMQAYEVTVYENINTPGLYRIANPYASHPLALRGVIEPHPDHVHYLDIDATDPGAVTISEQPMGFGIGGELLTLRSLQTGTLLSDIVRFPSRGLLVRIADSSFYANQYGRFSLRLPDPSSITGVEAAGAADSEIFDLQGRRLRTMPRHGVCIVGGRATIIL